MSIRQLANKMEFGSDEAGSMASSVRSEEAWELVLSHIPLIEMMRTSSLVSKMVRRAAVAALCTTLEIKLQRKHHQSFMDWYASLELSCQV